MASTKIKDFFNGRFFDIPRYQRGYSWERQNIRELFDDIRESIEANSNHYIGTIVLSCSGDEEERFYVVDGQQRITTLTMIINSLVRSLPEADKQFYQRFYIIESGRYRLMPLNRDNEYFIKLLNNDVGVPENKSQRFLRDAIEEINRKVSGISDKLQFLKSIEKLEIMEFVENSEGDAIRIFQTVNDRGKPLSNMEKVKSLLIYFSNRYLNREFDGAINDCFSDIFEYYDDIKHLGEELGINLIKNAEFTEDSLMRYHFVTFSKTNYEPTASFVLQHLKAEFNQLRTNGDFGSLKALINRYCESLKAFFVHCKTVIEKAQSQPRFYKMFVVLNLSATLYPLITQLERLSLLETQLPQPHLNGITFFDLVELIEVRVYKTRATDPKAHIADLVFEMENKTQEHIVERLLWFNSRWMPKEQFQSALCSNIYGNRALNHLFVTYCESLEGRSFTIDELKKIVEKVPNIEHILSQTPNFDPTAFGFQNNEDYIESEHKIGNLTLLEKSLNSGAHNLNPAEKISIYDRSIYGMTKKIATELDTTRRFDKLAILQRTTILADFSAQIWWCEPPSALAANEFELLSALPTEE